MLVGGLSLKTLFGIATRSHSSSIYVIERRGRVYEVSNRDEPRKHLFFDIEDRVESGKSEQGLLGLAFHPKFTENNYVYVFLYA